MSLINTYGLFWREDRVFWGKPGVAGRLLGVHADQATADSIDFREQTGIYVLYADYKLLYVGQAGNGNANLFDRLKKHLTDDLSGRWNQFSWFGLRWVKKDGSLKATASAAHPVLSDVLNHLEAILIASVEPALNRQGGRWGADPERYLQVRDEKLGRTVEEMIEELHKSLPKKAKKK